MPASDVSDRLPERRQLQTVVPVHVVVMVIVSPPSVSVTVPLESEHAAMPAHVRGMVSVAENVSCQFVAV